MKKRKKKVDKNWVKKALKRSRAIESKKDAMRAVELIKELYHIVIVKHG